MSSIAKSISYDTRVSPVYDYYVVIEGVENKLNCKMCHKPISIVTSSLMKHLKCVHPKSFDDYENKASEAKTKLKSNPFKRSSGKTSSSSGSSNKQMKMTKYIGNSRTMMNAVGLAVHNGVAFSLFDSFDMRELTVRAGNGDDSEKVVNSENVKSAIHELAKLEREELKKLLQHKIFSLSADFATCQRRSFLGVNAQFFDPDQKNVRLVNLSCKEVNERHFAANIKSWILDVLKQFLPEERAQQTFVYSVDSAANVSKAIDDVVLELSKKTIEALGLESSQTAYISDVDAILEGYEPTGAVDVVPDELKQIAFKVNCVVHKFQLAVNKFLYKDLEVSSILDKAIALTTKLRTPNIKNQLDIEKLNQAKVHQLTRWNSVHVMLKRLIELKEFCVRHEESFEALYVDDKTWKEFEKLLDVLDVAATLTSVMQGEKLLVPDFVYYWFKMTSKLDGMNSVYAKKLLACVKSREGEIMKNDVVKAGWFLDKTVSLLIEETESTEKAKAVIRMVHKKRATMLGTVVEDSIEENRESETDDDENDEDVDEFDIHLKTLGKGKRKLKIVGSVETSGNPFQGSAKQLEDEIRDYTKADVPKKKMNTITWWIENEEKYPLLSTIALDIISAPLTEVSVERLFSHLNFILTKHRSTLKGTLLDDILFLRLNQIFAAGDKKKETE